MNPRKTKRIRCDLKHLKSCLLSLRTSRSAQEQNEATAKTVAVNIHYEDFLCETLSTLLLFVMYCQRAELPYATISEIAHTLGNAYTEQE